MRSSKGGMEDMYTVKQQKQLTSVIQERWLLSIGSRPHRAETCLGSPDSITSNEAALGALRLDDHGSTPLVVRQAMRRPCRTEQCVLESRNAQP